MLLAEAIDVLADGRPGPVAFVFATAQFLSRAEQGGERDFPDWSRRPRIAVLWQRP